MLASEVAGRLNLPAGWYIQLIGDRFDLEDWEYSLNEPFDPVVWGEPDDNFLLSSREFGPAMTAEEVREKGKALVDRLNGAMNLMHGTRPVRVGAIVRIDEKAARHSYIFAESSVIALGRCRVRATAVILGPDGEPVPPPPAAPSDAQRWNMQAADNDLISDLLQQLGKAQDWYEIYKAIELTEKLAGGEHKLRRLLGSSAEDSKRLKQTANFYRHARASRPDRLTTLGDAKPLLNFMVRTVLEEK